MFRGPYKQYNRDEMLRDLIQGIDITTIAAKHGVNKNTVFKFRHHNVITGATALEQAIKMIELKRSPQSIRNLYGEDVYREALEWYSLS